MILNLPNTLTWFRIVAIPMVVVVFYLPALMDDPQMTWTRPGSPASPIISTAIWRGA